MNPDRPKPSVLVGIDGCRSGWIAAWVPFAPQLDLAMARVAVFDGFEALVSAFPTDAVLAVDMPIGLPDFTGPGGRGPERAIRPLLGERQSSVFSIPSRASVHAQDYREACRIALATSDPPRKVSKQAFHIFPRIREIDAILRNCPDLAIHEVHPELAFRALNGESPMRLPKKIRSRGNPEGLEERMAVLAAIGFDRGFLASPPRGAGRDDLLDACACLAVALRIARGEARPWPADYGRDSFGIPIAIWS